MPHTHHNRLHEHPLRGVWLYHQTSERVLQLDEHSQARLRHIIAGLQLHLYRACVVLYLKIQIQHCIHAGLSGFSPRAFARTGMTEAGRKLLGTVWVERGTGITGRVKGPRLEAGLDTEKQSGPVRLQEERAVLWGGVEDCQLQRRHHPQGARCRNRVRLLG